jgi:hypothetical protein
VRAEGSVETWLTSLLQTSQQSLHAIIRQAFIMISDLNFSLLSFLDKMPAQVNPYKQLYVFLQHVYLIHEYYVYCDILVHIYSEDLDVNGRIILKWI